MKDFDGCWTVINEAREQMIKSGRHQWTEQYPAYKDILADINNGNAYVLTVNDQIAVYGAVVLNGEPAYEFLEGKWLTNSNYYVIHRFATLPKLQRIRTHFHQQGVQPVRSGARAQHQGGHQLRQPAHGEPALVYGILPLWKGELW